MGLPGNASKIGIDETQNVGKTTMFNLLSKSKSQVPTKKAKLFKTNQSKVKAIHKRWEYLIENYESKRKFPITLTIVDIVGLAKRIPIIKEWENNFN